MDSSGQRALPWPLIPGPWPLPTENKPSGQTTWVLPGSQDSESRNTRPKLWTVWGYATNQPMAPRIATPGPRLLAKTQSPCNEGQFRAQFAWKPNCLTALLMAASPERCHQELQQICHLLRAGIVLHFIGLERDIVFPLVDNVFIALHAEGVQHDHVLGAMAQEGGGVRVGPGLQEGSDLVALHAPPAEAHNGPQLPATRVPSMLCDCRPLRKASDHNPL
mmetsp:Transcript_17940/g.31858  ORF Transcript_17940/g.31858 Transcript_17940/m.31858 type:complete len:220 (+) Transcript_17940:755-1414(+)